jgi:hypothetical protein
MNPHLQTQNGIVGDEPSAGAWTWPASGPGSCSSWTKRRWSSRISVSSWMHLFRLRFVHHDT